MGWFFNLSIISPLSAIWNLGCAAFADMGNKPGATARRILAGYLRWSESFLAHSICKRPKNGKQTKTSIREAPHSGQYRCQCCDTVIRAQLRRTVPRQLPRPLRHHSLWENPRRHRTLRGHLIMPGSSKTERKSRLMVNHILLTFAALKLIQRDKTEIATVATKNQGTAAKKYVTWSGMDLAQLHAEVQTDFDNLDVSKLSLHNQRLIAKVQRQWTLSHTSIASCKTWHILRCFADLDRTNWVADKDPSLRKCFQKISLRDPPKCKRRCEQPKKKKQKK